MTDDELHENTESESALVGDKEVQDEAWAHDVPPEDDFHDPDVLHEELTDDALHEEGLMEDDMADGATDGVPPVDKNRGKVVFYGILGLIAIIAGGLAYLQFGGQGGGDSFAPVAQMQNVQPQQNDVGGAPAPAPKAEEGMASLGGAEDLSSLYPAPQKQEPTSAPSEKTESGVSSEIMTLGNANNASPSDVAAPTAESMKEVVPAPEAAPTIKSTETIPMPPMTNVGKALPESTTAVPSPEVENKLKAMSGKIETLQEALDKLAQKNAELLDKLNAMQAMPATGASDTAELEARLARLEAKTKAKEPVASEASAKVPQIAPKSEPEGVALEESMVAPPKTVAKPAPKQKTTTAPSKAEKKVKSVKKAEPGVVLRAATPDAAWVSNDVGSSDLQRVTVGDTLPGIGKIKEIRQEGDQWVVVGTKGSVR